jgi:DNA-binding NtrC family response regulator
MTKIKRILLVDDERSFVLSLAEGLRLYAPWLEIETAGNGLEALEILKARRIDLLVTDLRMPGMNGFELLERMRGEYPGLPVFVISAHIGGDVEARLRQLGVAQTVEKPFELEELAEKIRRELEFGSEEAEEFSLDLFFSGVDSFLRKVFGKGRVTSCSK